MSAFPSSADEFYTLRDDRTNRCGTNPGYQSIQCVVRLSPELGATIQGQVMLITAANLLSRWCRHVTIVMPALSIDPALGFGNGNLADFVLSQMRDADPFGEFRLASNSENPPGLALNIGNTEGSDPIRRVYIDASDWLCSLSIERLIPLPASDGRNRLGAIAAACMGVGQLFKMAIGFDAENYIRNGIFNLFALAWREDASPSLWPKNPDVGRILMVGAGSVASSVAYSMRLAGLAGAVTVIDKDSVKIENFNRSPIFGRKTFGKPKSEALVHFMAGTTVSALGIPLWWNEFLLGRKRSSFDFDVWLPLANEFGVRLAMQSNVPPLMIHASTTANWGVNHGRHLPGRDDCLADRFPEQVNSADFGCSTGIIETEGAAIDAALPFVSLFAGLLVTADLVRAQLPGYPQIPNFALLDWYGDLDTIHAWDRRPRPGCLCLDQGVAFHDRFNGGTRYRALFGFSHTPGTSLL